MRRLLFVILLISPFSVSAEQTLNALAHVDPARTSFRGGADRLTLRVGMDIPVPYRVFTLDNPRRLVVDFGELDWARLARDDLRLPSKITSLRYGRYKRGWSRLVAELESPFAVKNAQLSSGPKPQLTIALVATSDEAFAAQARAPETQTTETPRETALPPAKKRQDGTRLLNVVIDPGHGGLDPGAQRHGHNESDLMLRFAREIAQTVEATGRARVTLTRADDTFVSLEARVAKTRVAEADLFISLHADALEDGIAHGATAHILSREASDEASAKLAERHDRDMIIAGVDLSDQGDDIANVLLDLARTETAQRSDRLAAALISGIANAGGTLHKHPRRAADFSVLKAADIPSVLLEVGFMSSPKDMKNLLDPQWRAKMAHAMAGAILEWAAEDAASGKLLRQ